MTSCAIVASSEETRRIAASALQSLGIAAAPIAAIAGLPAFLTGTPTSGILLELSTMMRATPAEKHILRELPDSFPLAKFRTAGDQIITAGITLERFAATCRGFDPRLMRAKARVVQYLPVFLSREPTFQDPEKATTLNGSEGGCMVYTVRSWTVGDAVWIRYHEDDSVVRGTVRSWVPWGRDKRMPGIGIEFDSKIREP